MNRKIKTEIAIGIILIISVIVGGSIWFTSKQTNKTQAPAVQSATPTAQPTSEAANWKTYTNDRYKFTLEYPQNLAMVAIDECGGEDPNGPESCSGVNISLRENADMPSSENVSMHFDILDKNANQSLDAFVNEATQKSTISKKTTEIINGKDAIAVKTDGVIRLGSIGKVIGKTEYTFLFLSPTKIGYFEYAGKSDTTLEEKVISTFKSISSAETKINYIKIEFDGCGKQDKYNNLQWWNDFKNKVEQVNFYSDDYVKMILQNTSDNTYWNPSKIDYTYDTYCADKRFNDSDICKNINKKLAINDKYGNDLEGCLSKDNSLFIVVFPGLYGGGGNHVFRYDVKNSVLKETERIGGLNKMWGIPPGEFLQRKGQVIQMGGSMGDAGCQSNTLFNYDFAVNQIKLIKSCSSCDVEKETCKIY